MNAQGTIVEVETTSGVWFKLAKVRTVQKPNPQVGQGDATHLESTAVESEPLLKDYGTITLDLLWEDGLPTDEYIEDWIDANENRQVRITGPTGRTRTFPAFPEGWEGSYEANAIMVGQLPLRVAGDVARSWAGS